MKLCQIDKRGVLRRESEVRRLLLPLVDRDVATSAFFQPRNARVIGSFSGAQPSADDYRSWRFRTPAPSLRGMYFERWESTDDTEEMWFLSRAYLSLYRVSKSRRVESELLSLHCDPNEVEENSHWRYKRGPHLHIGAAEQPLPHAHIALNLTDLVSVMSTSENLLSALGNAVEMLGEQVVTLYLPQ
jgi:hypothetical protein